MRISPTFLVFLALVLGSPAALADTIELTDGRLVEGVVMADPDGRAGLWVISRFGPTFVEKSEIKAHTKAKPIDEQIREYLDQLAPGDIDKRIHLATLMQKVGRSEEARALATDVLESAPEHGAAHELLGHVRHRGRWMTPDEAKRAEGLEKHGDKWYTPEEWKNVGRAEKEQAAAAEQVARQKFLAREVNEAVRLALSPDPAVRARGKKRLLSLNQEFDDERLRKLVAGIDDYIKEVDELRRKAADAAAAIATSGAMVMGEIRATLSRLKRPIQIFETSLASGPSPLLSPNATVKIQLPELEVIKVRTTISTPATVK